MNYKCKCSVCGAEFLSIRRNSKYCCNEHKSIALKQQKRNSYEKCQIAKGKIIETTSSYDSTCEEQDVDYSNSLYDWNSNEHKNGTEELDYQISKVEEWSSPLTYCSFDKSLHIAYISDIHLLHHLKYYDNNATKMIRDIVSKLYSSMNSVDVIIFGGDISSNTKITMAFYSYFMKTYDFICFHKFKDKLAYLKKLKKELSNRWKKLESYIERKNKIDLDIEKRKRVLFDFFNFSVFETYKNAYRSTESYKSAFTYYKTVKSYKKYNISESIENQIFQIAELLDLRDKYQSIINRESSIIKKVKSDIYTFERKYLKSIEYIDLRDYIHVSLKGVYAVLGNHEYIDFPDVSSCVSFYDSELSKLGITLLHNNYKLNDKFLIFGGTGFAKYEKKWNANKIVCCPNFNREDEIKETTIFEAAYKEAFDYAKENKLCFLCVSHYPISACLNNVFDKEAIYFTGHNHKNNFIKTQNQTLYADNQIGYEDRDITFRIATIGHEINPYGCLKDGFYKTSIEDYLQFYRYIGEYIGKGRLLYQRCQNKKASLYVLKRKGYYGFFLIATKGTSKGISIVNGGTTKKITESTDITWICENFDRVLAKYIQILTPLRKVQEQLSKELRGLGLSGTIHGCIVDIDFYHHIMINPFDGSTIFYYSSEFGRVLTLDSFDDVIQSLSIHSPNLASYDCNIIQEKYKERAKNPRYLLGMSQTNYLLETEKNNIMGIGERTEQVVSRKETMYLISEKISPLQRLFTGHVLRDFDLSLLQTDTLLE